MTQGEGLLIAVEQWHVTNWATLVGHRISTSVRPRSTNRSKNSVSIEFQTDEWAVSAVVWDSGETEVLTASKIDLTAVPAVAVHTVTSPEDVAALLDGIRDDLLPEPC